MISFCLSSFSFGFFSGNNDGHVVFWLFILCFFLASKISSLFLEFEIALFSVFSVLSVHFVKESMFVCTK